MKNRYSFILCLFVSIVLVQYRISHSELQNNKPLKITTWDAFGYYMYLPAFVIYNDATELKWFPEIDKKYELSGGNLYQANKCKNGNYAFKYLGGVAIMEAPFFFIGHFIALNSNYEADGFSSPYQYSIAFGALLYCILSLFLLRRILLNYFSDTTTGISILLLVMATNFIQYTSIESAMSHVYIFPLYVLIIHFTIRWHNQPSKISASLIGLIIGLATICRPTEAVMLFIPLLWNTHTKEESKKKWALVKQHRSHFIFTILFGIIGILPQLIYWKVATGSFVYDVGSKWAFLSPFFRVIVGWENGWFIYTPITIFFVLGLLFIKQLPFRKSFIVFCILNIWIVISWFDWKYGATYSTRALVQSYPVFIFPFAAIIEYILQKKWRFLFYAMGVYLVFVNLFQLKQYESTVLHYRDMNKKYYSKIYLNNQPTTLEMSLLDTDEWIDDESKYNTQTLVAIDSIVFINNNDSMNILIAETKLKPSTNNAWLKIQSTIKVENNFYGSYLHCTLQYGDSIKQEKIRLFNPISNPEAFNNYAFYIHLPSSSDSLNLKLYLNSDNKTNYEAKETKVIYLEKKIIK